MNKFIRLEDAYPFFIARIHFGKYTLETEVSKLLVMVIAFSEIILRIVVHQPTHQRKVLLLEMLTHPKSSCSPVFRKKRKVNSRVVNFREARTLHLAFFGLFKTFRQGPDVLKISEHGWQIAGQWPWLNDCNMINVIFR